MYIRLPLSVFQMEVLRTLNVAPTQLHPNNWGYIQAFAVMCQALAFTPIAPLFLHFFRCRPVAKRGWVSLISEPSNALLELYSQVLKINSLECRFSIQGGHSFFMKIGSRNFPCIGRKIH
ncbi:hypothetical protein VIGAN_08336400 [Vigna angularis var. angularis]|uniref:Transposase (putative) gypsy type domain-containing protein n=1 Tax=Vigna angularis var. angularis TaxID=157739 RepID=A0A0S3SU77_PHAAN|nr:hypothetical protein VIGAN_08336400 [Vigna angularis var. angularis]